YKSLNPHSFPTRRSSDLASPGVATHRSTIGSAPTRSSPADRWRPSSTAPWNSPRNGICDRFRCRYGPAQFGDAGRTATVTSGSWRIAPLVRPRPRTGDPDRPNHALVVDGADHLRWVGGGVPCGSTRFWKSLAVNAGAF